MSIQWKWPQVRWNLLEKNELKWQDSTNAFRKYTHLPRRVYYKNYYNAHCTHLYNENTYNFSVRIISCAHCNTRATAFFPFLYRYAHNCMAFISFRFIFFSKCAACWSVRCGCCISISISSHGIPGHNSCCQCLFLMLVKRQIDIAFHNGNQRWALQMDNCHVRKLTMCRSMHKHIHEWPCARTHKTNQIIKEYKPHFMLRTFFCADSFCVSAACCS